MRTSTSGNGPTRGRRDHLGRVAPPAHGDGAGGLGQPVGGQHRLDAHVGPERLDQLHRHHGRSGHHQPEGRQVEPSRLGVVEDRLEDGRRPGKHADVLVGHPLQDHVDVEHRLGHHGGPGHEAGQDPGLVSEGVEERIDDQVAVAGPQPDHLGPGGEGPERLAVGGHRPLGVAGGPRGEDQVGQVGRRQATPCAQRPRRARTGSAAARKSSQADCVPAVGPWSATTVSSASSVRSTTTCSRSGSESPAADRLVQHGRVVRAEEPLDGEEDPGTRRPQDVGGLGSLVAGVEREPGRPPPRPRPVRPRSTRRSWAPTRRPGHRARYRGP